MIRLFKNTDISELVKLLRLNTPKYFSHAEEVDFIEYLRTDCQNYFVVENQGVLIACGGINYGFNNGRTARLSWDIVHPVHQGKGVGRELVLYRIEQIKSDENVKRVVVRTSQYAHQFYEKLGFSLKATEKNFWSEGFDLYAMTLDITCRN